MHFVRNTWLLAVSASAALAGCLADPVDEDAVDPEPEGAAELALCPSNTWNIRSSAGRQQCVPFGSRVDVTPGAHGCPSGSIVTPSNKVICLSGPAISERGTAEMVTAPLFTLECKSGYHVTHRGCVKGFRSR